MARGVWLPRSKNSFTVGKTKLADYQTPQAAVDAVIAAGDFAKDNPYRIFVYDGIYDGQLLVHSVTDLSIVGESRTGTILRRSTTGGVSRHRPVAALFVASWPFLL